jgi:hypothetical protein
MAVKFSQFTSTTPNSNIYFAGYNSVLGTNVQVSYTDLAASISPGTGTTNYISKWTSSSALGNSLLTDVSNTLTYEASLGNASFNLKSPSGYYYPSINLFSNNTLAATVLGYNGRLYLTAAGNSGIWFGNSSGTQMLLTNSGRLLIGTTTESTYALDVVGTARFTGSAQIAGNGAVTFDVFGGSAGGASQAVRIYGTTPSTQGLLLSYDTGNAISYIDGAFHSTGSANAFGDIVFRSKQNATNTLVENMRVRGFNGNLVLSQDLRVKVGKKIRMAFYDNDTSTDGFELYLTATPVAVIATPSVTQLQMIVNSSTIARFYASSVGINGGSNAGTLDVYGTITNGQTLRQYYLGGGVSAALPTYSFYGDQNNGWFSPSADVQAWSVGGSEVMRLFSNGNFAIGTTTDAGYKLDVNGTLRGTGVFSLTGAGQRHLISGGFQVPYFYVPASQGQIAINNSADTQNIWIVDNSGNVYNRGTLGVGVLTPNASAVLDVTSTTKGFLPPRMTGAQAEAIATPAAGLLVYANNGNGTTITSTGWWGYDGTNWVKLN